MRLFVGVEIGEEARRAAAAAAAALRLEVASAVKAAWVNPANMHLTVRFIGHVEDSRVPSIVAALALPLETGPFTVELGACGAFPPTGAPRVLWIGLTRGLRELTALHRAFNLRLAPFGFEAEDREFRAHLTLARIKDARRGASASLRAAILAAEPLRLTVPVTRATIFQSHLSSRGARYEPLGHAPLGLGRAL